MTTVWVTGFPLGDKLRATAVVAVRDAMRILNEDATIGSAGAFEVLQGPRPICIGATEADTAVEAARSLLEAQGFQIGVDLLVEEIEALRTPQIAPDEPTVEDYDLSVAAAALLFMQMGDGNPMNALGAAAGLANVLGETANEPGVVFDAGVLLAEVFAGSGQMETMQIMAHVAGHEPEAE